MYKINVMLESLVVVHEFESLPDIRATLLKVARHYQFSYFGLYERKIAQGGVEVHWNPVLWHRPNEREELGDPKGTAIDDSWASLSVAHRPFYWDEAITAAETNPVIHRKLQAMIAAGLAAGISHGLTIPIFARNGLSGMLLLGRDRRIDLSPLEISLFDTLAKTVLRRCQEIVQRGNADDSGGFSVPELTGREFAILQNLADGQTSIDTGKALGLSNHTVDWYVSGLQEKLKARNRQNLVALAFRLGLVG